MNRFAPNNDSIPKNSYNLRIFLLLGFLVVFIVLITIKLFGLQISSHAHYKAVASAQHGLNAKLLPNRGDIYLSSFSGSPMLVATMASQNMIYAVPKELADKELVAGQLAGLLDVPKEEILSKFSGSQNFAPLKTDLNDVDVRKIRSLEIKGVYFQPQNTRLYPEKNLASQILGFLGFKGHDRVGQYGIEGGFESVLAGTPGRLGGEKDAAGRAINLSSRDFVPAQHGSDIYLTVDPAIQFKAQEVISSAVRRHEADSGSVIVADPRTGAVLAMANFPDFDPNNYGKVSDLSVFSNTGVTGAYEPGSVFKPVTMAAALNEGKILPDTTYEDMGVVKVDDKEMRNSDGKANGVQTMIQVLQQSLNTGMVFVQQQLGNEKFRDYVRKFGFGTPTNIELPSQPGGNLDNLNRRGDVFFATASFGQGLTVTPIQLIQAYTAFANGGKMVAPYIVDRIVHSNGTVEKPTRPETVQVISSKTASTISAMMVDVVENGHGKQAGVSGYYIAGKTGTAQVAGSRGGYDKDKTIGSFVGYGPVDDPKFLMIVRIDNPKGVKFAESTAAPAFGEIAQYILNYLKVEPSR
jgi:stage V sporulation protein D (sporulation-specific penicillin-binding protein)